MMKNVINIVDVLDPSQLHLQHRSLLNSTRKSMVSLFLVSAVLMWFTWVFILVSGDFELSNSASTDKRVIFWGFRSGGGDGGDEGGSNRIKQSTILKDFQDFWFSFPSFTGFSSAIDGSDYDDNRNHNSPVVDPQGYICYNPHSGFSNQVFALENALMVAYVLNRTLILPPAYIGNSYDALSWKKFDSLQNQLKSVETTNFNRHALNSKLKDSIQNSLEYVADFFSDISLLPWKEIANLSQLHGLVRTIDVQTFIGLKLFQTIDDIVQIRDIDRYAYRLFDSIPEYSDFMVDNEHDNLELTVKYADTYDHKTMWNMQNTIDINVNESSTIQISLNQFSHMINLDAMARNSRIQSAKLVQFGSLFGSTRLKLNRPENQQIMNNIKSSILLSHPIVEQLALIIRQQIMGSTGRYYAIHLRTRDGNFNEKASSTISRLTKAIETMFKANKTEFDYIYIATDTQDFRENPIFQPLEPYMHKIRLFQDFYQDIMQQLALFDQWRTDILMNKAPNNEQLHSRWNSDMSMLFHYVDSVILSPNENAEISFNELENRKLNNIAFKVAQHYNSQQQIEYPTRFSKLWIPFIEQAVCAHADYVIGTLGSTFSMIIERMFQNNHAANDQDYYKKRFKYI